MADIDLTEAIAEATDALLDAEHNGIDCRPFESLDVTAEKVVRAALPHIREQLAQQIETDAPSAELVREGSFASLASRRSGMLRAAFIVRGEA